LAGIKPRRTGKCLKLEEGKQLPKDMGGNYLNDVGGIGADIHLGYCVQPTAHTSGNLRKDR